MAVRDHHLSKGVRYEDQAIPESWDADEVTVLYLRDHTKWLARMSSTFHLWRSSYSGTRCRRWLPQSVHWEPYYLDGPLRQPSVFSRRMCLPTGTLRFAKARCCYGYEKSNLLPVTSALALQYGFPAVGCVSTTAKYFVWRSPHYVSINFHFHAIFMIISLCSEVKFKIKCLAIELST